MGELVRALRRAIELRPPRDDADFFVLNSTQGLDVRERIATHLDAALFESVIAAEVRRLGTSESFDRLVDLLSQSSRRSRPTAGWPSCAPGRSVSASTSIRAFANAR